MLIERFRIFATGIVAVTTFVISLSAQIGPQTRGEIPDTEDLRQKFGVPAGSGRPNPPKNLQLSGSTKVTAPTELILRAQKSTERAIASNSNKIEGLYLITFKKGTFTYEEIYTDERGERFLTLYDQAGQSLVAKSVELLRPLGGELIRTYGFGEGTFLAYLSEWQATELSRSPLIAAVEQDTLLKGDVSWGLDRIDQRSLPLDNNYSTNVDASGVHIYIIDSGIYAGHSDFSGRIGTGFTPLVDAWGVPLDPNVDTHGHGTYCAGIAAGTTDGVAKGATLHAVRVGLTPTASASNVVSGLDWIRLNRQNPAVASMSLGAASSVTTTIDVAAASLIASGVTFVCSAGNSGVDASNQSPAHLPEAITVGATTNTDAMWSGTNFGNLVDIWAPGDAIPSSYIGAPNATATGSGTSASAAFVAGVAAQFLKNNPNALPDAVSNSLLINSTIIYFGASLPHPGYCLLNTSLEWIDNNVNIVNGTAVLDSTDILHPNGNRYDDIRLTSNRVAIHADGGQVARVSWIDTNDDIVQAEISGPGQLQITLLTGTYSAPALPTKYNIPLQYAKGCARVVVEGSTAATFISIYSVGTANSSTPTIFIPGTTYDGFADLAQIHAGRYSAKLGGILAGNARLKDPIGDPTGILLPATDIVDRLVIHDIDAVSFCNPDLVIGPGSTLSSFSGRPVIAGGDLITSNGRRISVTPTTSLGYSALYTNANANSHGVTIPPLSLGSARLGTLGGASSVLMGWSCQNPGAYTPPSPGTTAP